MDYLKEKQYYIDNYDFKTIEECLYYAQSLHKEIQKFQKIKDKEKISDKKMGEDFLRMISMVVTSIKATRFEHKKVIESWMEKGKEKQEKFNNTEPLEIYCEGCEILTEPMHKSLWEEKESLSVSFIYNCPKCNKRKAYYDNGEEYKGKPTL